MKAIAVHPGKPGSIHLADISRPSIDAISDGRGVRVQVLTQRSTAPLRPGDDYLVIGHENFGRVLEVGPNVPDTIRSGGYVVASVRRPGSSIYGQIGLQDFTRSARTGSTKASFSATR